MSFCRGAGNSSTCGLNNFKLIPATSWNKVSVSNIQYFTTVSGLKNYQACYYELNVEKYTFKTGAKIQIFIKDAKDVVITVFGGTSRQNLTMPMGNKFRTGSLITLDASSGAALFVRPRDNRFLSSFEF